MKHLIILADGMADWPMEQLGGKTILQYAHTPNMDRMAQCGRCGMLKTVADGFHPGSEVANSSILGYDQRLVYEGRGPLEAASIGVELADDDLALRCNFVSMDGNLLRNHSCGRLETSDADILIKYLQKELGNERVHFYTGVQYRHLLAFDNAMLALAKSGLFAHAPERVYVHNEDKLLIYRRGDLLFALNYHTFATHTVPLPLSAGTALTLMLNSAAPALGGDFVPETALTAREGENGSFALSLTIPARTALVYRIGK